MLTLETVTEGKAGESTATKNRTANVSVELERIFDYGCGVGEDGYGFLEQSLATAPLPCQKQPGRH